MSDFPVLPDLETMVVDRLFLIYGKIAGFKRREKREPAFAVDLNDIPMIYTLIGPMLNPVPIRAAGSYIVTRNYIARVLGKPLGNTTDTKRGKGSQALSDLLPFFSRVRNYLIQHPNLEVGEPGDSDYLGPLRYIGEQLQLQDSGEGDVAGPGGIPHLAMDVTIRISMQVSIEGLA